MKMRNEDVKKITEIKQYLLDPPISFKLYDYALIYLKDAIAVLKNYPAANDVINYLQNLVAQFENKTIIREDLRKTLKDAGIKLSQLTSQ